MQSIEGARGIAALMVVLMHAANLMAVEQFSGHIGIRGIFGFGYVGVDFFFVLSGFIISFIHFKDIGRPTQLIFYLRRRFFRIFPIYWFCLTMAVAILALGRAFLHKETTLGFTSADIAGTIFLLPVSEPKFVGVAWSLQFEIMFYGLFALLVISSRIGATLFLSWFLAILWHLLATPNYPSYGGFLSAYSLQFLFGVATGMATSKKNFAVAGKFSLALGVCLFAASAYYERAFALKPHGPLGQVLLGISSALVLLSLVELEKRKQIHTPKFMYLLGSISYSVYLSHIVFITLIYSILLKLGLYHRLPEIFTFCIAVSASVLCSALIGFMIELPLSRWVKLHTAPSTPAPSVKTLVATNE